MPVPYIGISKVLDVTSYYSSFPKDDMLIWARCNTICSEPVFYC